MAQDPLKILEKLFDVFMGAEQSPETGPAASAGITRTLGPVPKGLKKKVAALAAAFADPDMAIEDLAAAAAEDPTVLEFLGGPSGSKVMATLGGYGGELPSYLASYEETPTSQLGSGEEGEEVDLDDVTGRKGKGKGSPGKPTPDATPKKAPKAEAMPATLTYLAEKYKLPISKNAATINPVKGVRQFVAEMASALDTLPDSEAKTALIGRMHAAMRLVDRPDTDMYRLGTALPMEGGRSTSILQELQEIGREGLEIRDKQVALDAQKADAEAKSKAPPQRPALRGKGRIAGIIGKMQQRLSGASTRADKQAAMAQMDRIAALKNNPGMGQRFTADQMSGIKDVIDKGVPTSSRAKASLKGFLGKKGALSGKNVLGGIAGLGISALLSKVVDRTLPNSELDLAGLQLDTQMPRRTTEEILEEMRASQDMQYRMMNAAEGVNPKIMAAIQGLSKPPMTSTQQYIGPNQLLKGLESGQITLDQLLGRV